MAHPNTKAGSTGSLNSLSLLLSAGHGDESFAHKYLTFYLDDGFYGVPIHKVQEIISLLPITPLPRVPHGIRGLMNLRGRVVSVLDLRSYLDLQVRADDNLTSIMVIRLPRQDRYITLGAIVDRIAAVQDIPPDQIEPAPTYNSDIDASLLTGLSKLDGQVTALLDIDKIIDSLLSAELAVE